MELGHIQSVADLTDEPEVWGLIPGLAHTFMEIDHQIFPLSFSPFALIQEGQLSVTGETMGTLYCLLAQEVYASPGMTNCPDMTSVIY